MKHLRVRLTAALCAAFLASLAPAQETVLSDTDRDFEFASFLIDLGFADYAERMVEEIVRLQPSEKDRAAMVRVEVMTARRKFAEALDIIKTMPPASQKTSAARMIVALGYYGDRQLGEARKQFDDIFKTLAEPPKDPDARRFYMDAAYKHGQLLETLGDLKAACDAYERSMKACADKDIARRLKTELAEMMARAAAQEKAAGRSPDDLLKRADDLCNKIQWEGDPDLWAGRSFVVQANVKYVRGQPKEAAKILRQNMDIIKGVDDLIREEKLPLELSPMAGALYLQARINDEEGRQVVGQDEKKGRDLLRDAVTKFATVFAKYGDNPWASDAFTRADELARKFKFKIDWGPLLAEAAQSAARRADDLFGEHKFADAATAYLKIINMMPESNASAKPLGNLLLCYANLDDQEMFGITRDHIAERYGRYPDVGPTLLLAAKYYLQERSDTNRVAELYRTFAEAFPKHEKTPQALYFLGDVYGRLGRAPEGMQYFERLAQTFSANQYGILALNRVAWSYYGQGTPEGYQKAREYFAQYVKRAEPGFNQANALFSLADCAMRLNNYPEARTIYDALLKKFSEGSVRLTTAEEEQRGRELQDKATYYSAFCLTKLNDPAADVPKFRVQAVELLQAFLKNRAQSPQAPQALNLVGTIQLELGKTEEAAKTFEELQAKYPDSKEGRSALFAQVKATMDIAKYDATAEAFRKMLAEAQTPEGRKRYGADQFVWLGEEMLKAQELAPLAVQAFQEARRQGSADRKVEENMLFGLGRALAAQGQRKEAADALDELFGRFPNTGYFFEAKLALGVVCRELGRFPESGGHLGEIFLAGSATPEIKARANLEIARTQEAEARGAQTANQPAAYQDGLKKAVVSCLRIYQAVTEAQRPEVTRPTLAPFVDEALRMAIRLDEELGRLPDAIAACEEYEARFKTSAHAREISDKKSDLRRKLNLSGAAAAPAAGARP